jgi:hypothetical protein
LLRATETTLLAADRDRRDQRFELGSILLRGPRLV